MVYTYIHVSICVPKYSPTLLLYLNVCIKFATFRYFDSMSVAELAIVARFEVRAPKCMLLLNSCK